MRRLAVVAASLGLSLFAADAAAAPPWVDRPDTNPAGVFSFDVGLGISHHPDPDLSGVGINFDMAVGIIDRLELGVRTGLRPGDPGERAAHGDEYARLFDRQTFATGADVFANPEVRVRGALVRHRIVELALEGRVVLPLEGGTNAGMLFGMPLAFHLGERVRLDTGVYVPVVFTNDPDEYFAVSIPFDFWIQITRQLWLGPMTGVKFQQPGNRPTNSVTDVSLGFGLGYQITSAVDFKTMLLFPTLNHESRIFGVGAGVEIRIE
jgi:hypothetical protein